MRIATRRVSSPKSIASKLIAVAGVALVTVLALAIQALIFANSSHRTADRVYENGFLEIAVINKLSSAVENHRRIVESAPAEVDRDVTAAERRQLEELNNRIESLVAESHIASSAPSEPSNSIARDVAMMVHLGLQTNEYASNFAIDMAKASAAEYSIHARRVAHHITDYRAQQVANAEAAFRNLKADAVREIWLVCLGFGATLLIVFPFGVHVVRGMLKRLKQLHGAINELSRGNLSIQVPFWTDRDEIGQVARALRVLHTNGKALVENKSELAQRNQELAQLSSTLEQRVAERTAEARTAVDRAEHINNKLLAEIAAKNRIEEDLRSANRDLIAATRAKSQFLANVSHEIRTPIMGVLGMSDLLLKGTLGKQQRHFAETIAKSAQILLGIVNDILDLSRMDAGKLTLDSHELALDGFVEDVIQVSAPSANSKKLRLDAIIESDVPHRIMGDSVRLRQILLNLISNAIKFTAAGGVTVHVRVVANEYPAQPLQISVRDTGIGISPDQQSKLFNAFSQADPSITRKFGGTGLGLVICKNLVEMMGGSIGITSELEVGTEVTFRIPLVPATNDALPLPLADKRICYIADTTIGCEALRHRLARLGAAQSYSTSLVDALACLAHRRHAPPNAVIVATSNAEADAERLHSAAEASGISVRILAVVAEQHPESSNGDLVQFLPWPALSHEIVAAIAAHRADKLICSSSTRPASGEPRVSDARAAGTRVLVAEDNPINQEVISEYLQSLGCRITVVDNGESAVQSFETNAFDIVLLDCQMPRMDGYMAARRIRQIESDGRRPHLPIVAITANTFDSDRQKCIESGMDAILSKPFTQEQLAVMLSDQLWPETKSPSAERLSAASPDTVSDAASSESTVASPAPRAPAKAPSKPAALPERGWSMSGLHADIAHALTLEIIDANAIASQRSRNPRLLQRMIDLYGRHTPTTLAELQRALAQNDWNGVKSAAHTMKSSSRGLGAERLASLLAILEAFGRAVASDTSVRPDAVEADELSALVLREVAAAMQALDGYRDPPLRDTA